MLLVTRKKAVGGHRKPSKTNSRHPALGIPGVIRGTSLISTMDRGVVMEPMQGKLASSQFDFVYTEQFCIPGVTSVFFSSCDSVVGDSLEFNQPN